MQPDLSKDRLARIGVYSESGLSVAFIAALMLHALVYLAWFGQGGSGLAKTASVNPSRMSLALRSPSPNLILSRAQQEPDVPVAPQFSPEQLALDASLTQKREKYRRQERKLEQAWVQAQNDLQSAKPLPVLGAEPAVSDASRFDQIFGQEGKLIQCVNEQGQTFTVILAPPASELGTGALILQPQVTQHYDPCVQG